MWWLRLRFTCSLYYNLHICSHLIRSWHNTEVLCDDPSISCKGDHVLPKACISSYMYIYIYSVDLYIVILVAVFSGR